MFTLILNLDRIWTKNTILFGPKCINSVFLNSEDMKLHYGDLTDSTCLVKIINEVKPTEIYNLGAQSHVKVSSF